MKISQLKPKATTTVELSFAPGLFVTLAVRDTPAVKAAMAQARENAFEAQMKGRKRSDDDKFADSLAVLRNAVVGIEDTTPDPMPFTPETVDELLAIDWVREELEKALWDYSRFF